MIKKLFLKSCLYFISFYKTYTFYWIEFDFLSFFFLWYIFGLIGICLRTTQNIMFSALKPKPLSSRLSLLLRWKNNEPSEHKPSHKSFSSWPFDYTWINFQAFFNRVSGYWFFLIESLASTTDFSFFVLQLLFLKPSKKFLKFTI